MKKMCFISMALMLVASCADSMAMEFIDSSPNPIVATSTSRSPESWSDVLRQFMREGKMREVLGLLVLARGVSVDTCLSDGRTPLMIAVEQGDLNMVKYLHARGADITLCDYRGRSASSIAQELKHDAILRLFELDDRDVFYDKLLAEDEKAEKENCTTIQSAAASATPMKAKKTAVKKKNKKKSEPKVVSSTVVMPTLAVDDVSLDMTKLMNAAQEGNIEVFHELIEQGERFDQCNKSKISVLHFAAQGGSSEIVRELLEKKMPINMQDAYSSTPLMYAVSRRCVDVMKLLISSGADVDVRDCKGTTALMHAVDSRWYDGARLLLDAGADEHIVDNKGKTALSRAVALKHSPLRALLDPEFDLADRFLDAAHMLDLDEIRECLRLGVDIDTRDKDSLQTALFYAVKALDEDGDNRRAVRAVVKELLHAHASPNIGNIDGISPLMVAVDKGDEGIVQILLNAHADPEKCDRAGRDAHDWAHNVKIAGLLI